MNEYSEKIFLALKNLKNFNEIQFDNSKISRLGGLTNFVHLVKTNIGCSNR